MDLSKISRRKLECLKLMAQGLGPKDIAKKMGIARKTVKFHSWRLSQDHGSCGTRQLVTMYYKTLLAEREMEILSLKSQIETLQSKTRIINSILPVGCKVLT